MSRTSLRLAAPLALVALAVTGCAGPSGAGSPSTAAAGGAITVTATDTTCELSATTARAGTITFEVTNTGSKVNEFYIYGEGDRIVGEVENITPGLKRELKIEVSEPGTLTTACKPGMVGDGIRGTFTVTGTATAGSADTKIAQAISAYKGFIASEADEFASKTKEFVTAVKARDVAKAKALYAEARHPWEAIEPVAESFGDLDPRIDGREDVAAGGREFTGYHRLEKDLWKDGLQPDSSAIADRLLADVTEIAAKAKTVEPTALSIANGAKALLDEVATGKITGEEERYSHTDLWDFDGNLEGSEQALLESHRVDGDYRSYTDLTDADLKALTVGLDALAEQVAKVPGVVQTK
jgi:iron uptake system component EfeO